MITECKIDIMGIYRYYENSNISVLTLGDETSSFISIQNRNIHSFKSLNINIDDDSSIDSYEFVNDDEEMTVLNYQPQNIEIIFKGSELTNDINFLNPHVPVFNNIRLKALLPYIIIILIYFFINSFLSTKKLEENNNKIKSENNTIQSRLLTAKNENIPDYSKDISELTEIIKNMKYHNHYKFLRFLIDESSIDTGFSKIIYENNIWIIEGDSIKFKNIEKLEIKLGKYAQNLELIFIKSKNKLLTFQYKIGDIIWD